MAAYPLPAPGTRYGPCVEDCKHKDCAESRRMAAALCVHCKKPIGYDNPFFTLQDPTTYELTGELAHETCHYVAVRGAR